MVIGINKDSKIPSDTRVTLTPSKLRKIIDPGINDIVDQSLLECCFLDNECLTRVVTISDSLCDCELLLCVQEVRVPEYILSKTYFFFFHTIKKQPHKAYPHEASLHNGIGLINNLVRAVTIH